jgi:alkanesulfonate monooxygenase SsuD/methylene tetrahydromethanopterin reductase-like flavin-dependent oxidoreductase (luciferase family)
VQFGAHFVGSARPPEPGQVFGPQDFARCAEEVGFDSVWCGDHVVRHQDGIATLAALAAATTRVTVGAAVIVVPMRPAAITAKGVLTAAIIADGRRTVLGVGPGGDVPKDFELVGADLSTRGAYTDEALDVIRLLWSGEPVSYSGRWNEFTDIQMWPRPVRRPDIFVGGRSDAALRRAVRVGEGYLPYLVDPRQARSRFERIVELAAGVRALDGFTFGVSTFMVAGRSIDDAARAVFTGEGFKDVDESRVRRFYLLGTAQDCVDQLRAYVESGANHIVIGCSAGHERQLDSYMETMADVLPAIRAEIDAGLGSQARRSMCTSSGIRTVSTASGRSSLTGGVSASPT